MYSQELNNLILSVLKLMRFKDPYCRITCLGWNHCQLPGSGRNSICYEGKKTFKVAPENLYSITETELIMLIIVMVLAFGICNKASSERT